MNWREKSSGSRCFACNRYNFMLLSYTPLTHSLFTCIYSLHFFLSRLNVSVYFDLLYVCACVFRLLMLLILFFISVCVYKTYRILLFFILKFLQLCEMLKSCDFLRSLNFISNIWISFERRIISYHTKTLTISQYREKENTHKCVIVCACTSMQ